MGLQAVFLLFLCVATALLASVGGSPVVAPGSLQAQEGFEEARFYGKWYGIALGTTCQWMKQYKERFNMGTLVVAPGKTSQEISFTSTQLRQGACSQVMGDYQKTGVPGKFTHYNPKWKAHIENYVVRTDYDAYAFVVMKKNSTHGLTTTAKLYGRSPEVQEALLAEFRQFALDLGIPEDSIFTLNNAGKGVRPTRDQQRAADDCLLPMDAGPCLGMMARFFYNTSSQTCESFFYGGCLGNDNNFASERTCLQTCRTEAACRLPVQAGGPCSTEFWAFDAAQGKCVTFRGCGGNSNKFYLEKECKEYCGVLPDGDEEFLHLAPQ